MGGFGQVQQPLSFLDLVTRAVDRTGGMHAVGQSYESPSDYTCSPVSVDSKITSSGFAEVFESLVIVAN